MIKLIPFPNIIKEEKGTINFSNYKILIEKKYQNAVKNLNNELSNRLKIDDNANEYEFSFVFSKEIKEEAYIIYMDKEATSVLASGEKGFYYATRTLSQLFNLKKKGQINKITSKIYYIEDKPRFAFRSFMLDESRHFFGCEEVKKIISVLSDLKINTLHWHLSDDQGFRIDFPNFPKLKEIASKRLKTKINSQENDDWDNNEYQRCYSCDQILDIVKYAKEKYVEIIPEIDMPGHTSAIVSAYPILHCFDKQYEVRGDFGVFKEIMCPGKDTTYDFAKKLVDELCKLFSNSKYIHIGGDEVNHENYEKCPNCQKKMKELNLDNTIKLQAHFSNEIAKHIMDNYNKKVIMWHDGVFDDTDNRVIMQYWNYKMELDKIDYINQGRKTIYSPCSQFYFNDPYGELPIVRTYNRGIHLTSLKRNAYKNILGMECCLWSEWVENNNILEFQIMPRLMAFSEASWTNTINHDFTNFVEIVENMEEFYNYYNLVRAPKKIYLAKGNEYRNKISKLYRGTEKEIEYNLAYKKKVIIDK